MNNKELYRITMLSDFEGTTTREQWLSEYEVDKYYRAMQRQRSAGFRKAEYQVIDVQRVFNKEI